MCGDQLAGDNGACQGPEITDYVIKRCHLVLSADFFCKEKNHAADAVTLFPVASHALQLILLVELEVLTLHFLRTLEKPGLKFLETAA